jgi:heme exporter protein D
MSWGSASAFFAMGGYALYVWGAYGMAAAVVALELWSLVRRRRTLRRRLGRTPSGRGLGRGEDASATRTE